MRKFLTLLLLFFSVAEVAWASNTGGMEWETPLQTVVNSLTGPTAGLIALAALAGCFYMLVFGGEMNAFVQRLVYVVVAVAGLVFCAAIGRRLFGISGAVVTPVARVEAAAGHRE